MIATPLLLLLIAVGAGVVAILLWGHIKMVKSWKLIVVLLIVGTLSAVLLRHYIPQLREVFVTLGVDAQLTEIEAAVVTTFHGNPAGLITILSSCIGVIGVVFKTFRDKTSNLIETFSNEKATAESQINQLKAQSQELLTQVTTERDTALSTVQTLEQDLEVMGSNYSKLQTDLVKQQTEVQRLLQENKDLVAQNGELHIAIQQLKPPTLT